MKAALKFKCLDCPAEQNGYVVTHSDACPLLAAYDRASDDDRRWFEKNPGMNQRDRRPATPAEQQFMELSEGWRPTHVDVVQLAPGWRIRRFRELVEA